MIVSKMFYVFPKEYQYAFLYNIQRCNCIVSVVMLAQLYSVSFHNQSSIIALRNISS